MNKLAHPRLVGPVLFGAVQHYGVARLKTFADMRTCVECAPHQRNPMKIRSCNLAEPVLH